ncbi:MAG: methyltransferase domain-containing protein [Gammaproteobacteria bacterium]|nr:methyltransferase domain-containing protein [Gammaproteobacteria bacterium]
MIAKNEHFALHEEFKYSTAEEASFYHINSWQQWEVAKSVFAQVALQGCEFILDAGCGTGRLCANLADRVAKGRVFGVDIDAGMIEFSKRKHLPFYNNLEFQVGSFLALDAIEKYDLACSFSALHWCGNLLLALQKMWCALKPGGRLIFSVPMAPNKNNIKIGAMLGASSAWGQYFKRHAHPRARYSISDCEKIVHDAKFQSVEVVSREYTFTFESRSSLADWFACTSPLVAQVPLELKQEFLAYFTECHLEVYGVNSLGGISYDWAEIQVSALKGFESE